MTHLHFPNTFEQGLQPPSPAPTHSHILLYYSIQPIAGIPGLADSTD